MFGRKKKDTKEKQTFDEWVKAIDKENEPYRKKCEDSLEISKLYGNGFYNEALAKLNGIENKTIEDYILTAKCYIGLGDRMLALYEYDKAVMLCREVGDEDRFLKVLKGRFYVEQGIVEHYELTCKYNFELSGEVLWAIQDLEKLKVNSIIKWDYYNQKCFSDIYKAVQYEVDSFNSGESNRLNKTTCKGAERWLNEWGFLIS